MAGVKDFPALVFFFPLEPVVASKRIIVASIVFLHLQMTGFFELSPAISYGPFKGRTPNHRQKTF